jgi:hypothetical protein
MSGDDQSSAGRRGDIADEFVEAFRQGQRPSVEEFARRYPQRADDICDILPAPGLMEQANSAENTPGQRRQPDAAPLRPPGGCQTPREAARGGRGREPSDHRRKEQLHVLVRDTAWSLCRGPRRGGHIDRGVKL